MRELAPISGDYSAHRVIHRPEDLPPYVTRWVLPDEIPRLAAAIRSSDWPSAVASAAFGYWAPLCIDLLLTGCMPRAEAPAILGEAIFAGGPGRCDDRLKSVLADLRQEGRRLFGAAFRKAGEVFLGLPKQLTIYRGIVEAESGPDFGIHWTLWRTCAVWFALYGRSLTARLSAQCRPLLLTATVDKEALCGLFTVPPFVDIQNEVLVLSSDLRDVRREVISAEDRCDAECLEALQSRR